MRDQTRQNIMSQNQMVQMKSQEEAIKLKEEKARNENIIRRQREAELMKNNNVKQMIRQQKLMAEERKEMVSQQSNYRFLNAKVIDKFLYLFSLKSKILL